MALNVGGFVSLEVDLLRWWRGISSVLDCFSLSSCRTVSDMWSGGGEGNHDLSPIGVKRDLQAWASLGFLVLVVGLDHFEVDCFLQGLCVSILSHKELSLG